MALKTEPTRVNSYRQLIAWQKAIDLVTSIYDVTRNFPPSELYGLVSQLRRSAVSVPSNIAEGQGRATKGEFIQFLCHARGSLFELETQTVIARKLGYISSEVEEHLAAKATEVARILNGLLTSLGAKTRRP
jgi:four helix bundle protein